MATAKEKGIRSEVIDCIIKNKALTSVSESVPAKLPTEIRISAMFCALCARVFRCMAAYTLLSVVHDSRRLKKQTKTTQPLPKKNKTLSVCEFDHGPFKQFVLTIQNCKIWALVKILNECVARLETDTGIITATLHKVAEDFKYVHSISSLGLC